MSFVAAAVGVGVGVVGSALFSDGPDIPGPDPQIGQASLEQIRLNREMFDDYRNNERPWMRRVTEEVLATQRGNAQRANALSDYQLDSMRRNDERYWNTAVPFENELLSDARRFDSQAYKNQLVSQALTDTQAQFDGAQQQQLRGLARMGVTPTSGKFQALSNQTAIAKAAAMASAANKTRQAADQIGLSTKMQMYGGMRGLAGLGAANAQLGLGAMGVGNQSATGMSNAAGAYIGGNNAALDSFNRGMSQGIQGLTGFSNAQINAANYAANYAAQNDPLNTILGAAAGIGTSWALKKFGG
jgi:hypothetical protein